MEKKKEKEEKENKKRKIKEGERKKGKKRTQISVTLPGGNVSSHLMVAILYCRC